MERLGRAGLPLGVFFSGDSGQAKFFLLVIAGQHMNLEESYRALGLNPGASLQEARRSYHQLVKFFHPDRHQASPGLLRKATEETKKLNLAYQRICKVFGAGLRSTAERRTHDK